MLQSNPDRVRNIIFVIVIIAILALGVSLKLEKDAALEKVETVK